MEVEEKEQESDLDMVSTSSFMQANLQHSIVASRVISRAVSVKGIYMTLIQELWISQVAVVFSSLLDLSPSWGSLGSI